ncbi:Gustatory receptor 28b [Carabus blaptoides fortunei]
MIVTTNTVVFHWMQKAVGLAPYVLTGETYSVLQYMSLYPAILLSLMLVFIYYCAGQTITIAGVPFSSYVTCIGGMLSLRHLIFRQTAAVNAHNDLIAATYALNKYKQIDYKRLDTARTIEFVFSVVMMTCSSVYMVRSSEKAQWYSCLVVIYCLVMRIFLLNEFTWMINAVNINLTAVNELLDAEQIYMSKGLSDVTNLHERFSSCGEVTNEAFSMALFCWCMESFIKISYSLYHLSVCTLYPAYVTCGIARGESLFNLIWHLVQLCYMVRLCQLSTSAAQSSPSIIHEILRNSETSEDVTENLEKFSFQLIPKFYFSGNGFFIVDYTFITTLVGLITTYVMIFVQFFVMDNANILPDVKEVHTFVDRFKAPKN